MTPQIHDHLTANGHLKKRTIMLNNFLGGLAWGLGSVLGATVVVTVLVAVLHTVNIVPFVGNFVSGVVQIVDNNKAPSNSPFKK